MYAVLRSLQTMYGEDLALELRGGDARFINDAIIIGRWDVQTIHSALVDFGLLCQGFNWDEVAEMLSRAMMRHGTPLGEQFPH